MARSMAALTVAATGLVELAPVPKIESSVREVADTPTPCGFAGDQVIENDRRLRRAQEPSSLGAANRKDRQLRARSANGRRHLVCRDPRCPRPRRQTPPPPSRETVSCDRPSRRPGKYEAGMVASENGMATDPSTSASFVPTAPRAGYTVFQIPCPTKTDSCGNGSGHTQDVTEKIDSGRTTGEAPSGA